LIAAGKRICDYRTLKTCFPQYKTMFLEFEESDHGGEKATCYCLQNCLDSNVIVEKFQVLKGTKTLLGSIGGLVIMKKYPLIRFQREVIFTLTDFFGMSLRTLTFASLACMPCLCVSPFLSFLLFKSQSAARLDSSSDAPYWV
jgi:hypothetical protein